jgi:hypothetical protein
VIKMAYIRKRKINGRPYFYLVESHRVNGKVVKNEYYLGTKPPLAKSRGWQGYVITSRQGQKISIYPISALQKSEAKEIREMAREFEPALNRHQQPGGTAVPLQCLPTAPGDFSEGRPQQKLGSTKTRVRSDRAGRK